MYFQISLRFFQVVGWLVGWSVRLGFFYFTYVFTELTYVLNQQNQTAMKKAERPFSVLQSPAETGLAVVLKDLKRLCLQFYSTFYRSKIQSFLLISEQHMGHTQRWLTTGIAQGSILDSSYVMSSVTQQWSGQWALERTLIRLAEDTVWGTQMILLRAGLPHRQPWKCCRNGTTEMEIQQGKMPSAVAGKEELLATIPTAVQRLSAWGTALPRRAWGPAGHILT